MNDKRVPSSDLELARALSRRLRAPRGETPAKHAEPSPRYVRFDARRAAPESVFGAFAASSPFGADVWNHLLDGCLATADARSAFLIDAQGLVVATRGDLSAEAAESIGARLMVALDQSAQLLQPSAPSVAALEIELGWLTGLRSSDKRSRSLTLGIVAQGPLGRDIREAVLSLLATASAD
ncbi:MAG: hypothetical protein IPG04_07525 [Polyangiaceae bacterium]|nr:hypothetical protein [Polyangiaceae bacterium]